VLSLGLFPVRPLVDPTAISVSPLLDVSIDLAQYDVPVYKVTMRNRSTADVLSVDFQTFRGEVRHSSGRHSRHNFAPIVPAKGEHEFLLPAVNATSPGIDRFEVTAVLWSDGVVAGDPSLKSNEEALAAGQAQQLERLLQLLQNRATTQAGTVSNDLSTLKVAIDALPVTFDAVTSAWGLQMTDRQQAVELGQQGVRASALRDIEEFAKKNAPDESASAWITSARTKYLAWLQRIRKVSAALRSR
jgi:hypothetical protein